MRLVLAMNVAVGIADMDLAELGKEVDAGTIGGPKLRFLRLSVPKIAGEQRPSVIVQGMLEALKKSAMTRRHVVPHFLEIDGQGIGSVTDPQPGIETRHNRALSAGFSAERLR